MGFDMYSVVRVSPEGYKGYKIFKTRYEAEEWLKSDSVKKDKEYGFTFYIEKK